MIYDNNNQMYCTAC